MARNGLTPSVLSLAVLSLCQCLFLVAPAFSQQTPMAPYRIVAITDQIVPDTPEAVFRDFAGAVVSSTGAVCFFGETDEPSTTDRGIWSDYHGSLRTVVKDGDDLANVTEELTVAFPSFVGSGNLFCNDEGAVFFEGASDSGLQLLGCATDRANVLLKISNDGSFAKQDALEEITEPMFGASGHIVFTNRVGGAIEQLWKREPDGVLNLLASTDSPAPGQPGRLFVGGFHDRQMNSVGDVAFTNTAANPANPIEDSANGIWSDRGGELHLVAADGTRLPDQPSNADSSIGELYWMNDRGEIAFRGSWETDTSPSEFRSGIYVANESGSIRKAVDTEFPAEAIILNNGVLYYSLIEEAVKTIYREGQKIVAEQDLVPQPPGIGEQVRIAGLGDWTVNSRGTLFFNAILDGSQIESGSDEAILSIPKAGDIEQILREGDVLDLEGGDFRTVEVLPLSIGNRGSRRTVSETNQVAMVVRFTDFSKAVILAGTKEIELVVNAEDDQDDGTCDEVHCSLREAINAANEADGFDRIVFDIPRDGSPYTIQPMSPLPSITDTLEIDGSTQRESGLFPIIEIDGGAAGPHSGIQGGLTLAEGSDNSTINHLIIGNFAGSGIHIDKSTFNTIQGCYIGTTRDGASLNSNLGDGINLFDSADNLIGGRPPREPNLISGNSNGIAIVGDGSTRNLVRGNFIGTNYELTESLGNTFNGIEIRLGANENIVGGTVLDEGRNIIAGNGDSGSLNGGYGVRVTGEGTERNTVIGNRIGYFNPPGPGFMEIGNLRGGILIDENASSNSILENSIRFNGGDGIAVLSGRANAIRRNPIEASQASFEDIPIDLGGDGPTANDAGDEDAGPNDLLNYPEIIAADIAYTTDENGNFRRAVILRGRLNVANEGEYLLDLFAAKPERAFFNAPHYIGTALIPVTGEIPFRFDVVFRTDFAFLTEVEPKDLITATVTDTEGNTSEANPPVEIVEVLFPDRREAMFSSAVRWRGTLGNDSFREPDLINLLKDWRFSGPNPAP